MNFLRVGCCTKYGRVSFWTTPCCRDVINRASVPALLDHNPSGCSKATGKDSIQKLCSSNLRLTTGLTQSTQVRYQQPPKLHRDLRFPNFDDYRKDEYKNIQKTKFGSGDEKPGYAYAMSCFGLICTAYVTKSCLFYAAAHFAAAQDVLAMATIEVDLSKVPPGGCISYLWRGKPVFVKHRTNSDIAKEAVTPLNILRDPETPEQRVQRPEWLIVIGICTHLGCVPMANLGDFQGGFYCPCHGSHFDNIGRCRKGPAPLNLVVPPYVFLTDTMVLVG